MGKDFQFFPPAVSYTSNIQYLKTCFFNISTNLSPLLPSFVIFLTVIDCIHLKNFLFKQLCLLNLLLVCFGFSRVHLSNKYLLNHFSLPATEKIKRKRN